MSLRSSSQSPVIGLEAAGLGGVDSSVWPSLLSGPDGVGGFCAGSRPGFAFALASLKTSGASNSVAESESLESPSISNNSSNTLAEFADSGTNSEAPHAGQSIRVPADSDVIATEPRHLGQVMLDEFANAIFRNYVVRRIELGF